MAFCSNCGNELPENAKVCPNCGKAVESAQQTTQSTAGNAQQTTQSAASKVQQATNTADYTAQFDPKDIADHKGMAVLCYLSWLFLIPLLAEKDSPFVRYHLNQGIILFLASLISGLLTFICIGVITDIICFVLMIIGIVNVCNGRAKDLPIIGKFRLLK